MTFIPEDLLKILLAVIVGAAIGLEREFRDKPAGFRTIIFITIGATLFTIFSHKLAPASDPNRIAANIVSGVGFLGAGVILREHGKVVGLTTAATIWLAAALGMGIGGGQYILSFSATAVISLVLWVFPYIERRIDAAREEHCYQVVCNLDTEFLAQLDEIFEKSGLIILDHSKVRKDQTITCTWTTLGSHKAHNKLTALLLNDPKITELQY
ncbi:MAG: MgtC/SapB family protein [Anaerolineaceae bacterium]|nr:MgtC/SapB family protein [Anaerolineaceae bacterium]